MALRRPTPTPRGAAQVVDLVRRTRATTRTSGSARRCAARSTWSPSPPAGRRCAAVPADDWQAGLDAALVVAVRPDPAARVRGPTPEEVVARALRAGVRAADRPTAAEGATRGKPEPAGPGAGRTPAAHANPKHRKRPQGSRTVGRSHAVAARAVRRGLPRGRRARRAGAATGRWPRTRTARWRWWPTWCTPPTRRCGAQARRLARAAGPRPVARRAPCVGAVRRGRAPCPASRGGDLDVDASMDGDRHRARRAAGRRPRRADRAGLGRPGRSRCACWSTRRAR